MDSLLQDLRYALRGLLRTPGFTLVALAAMALGIGGTAAIYALLDGMVLRPLSLPNGDELVRLYEVDPAGRPAAFAPANFLDYARETPSLKSAAAFDLQRWNLATKNGPEKLPLGVVSANFFRTLETRPALGRDFLPEEEFEAKAQRAILTDATWKRRFGGRPDVLGETLTLNGKAFTIVGVLPRGFLFPLLQEAQAYLPLGLDQGDLKNRGGHQLSAIGRLAPGVTPERASADLAVVARRLAADHAAENAGWSARATGLRADVGSDAAEPLTLAMAAAALLLLLACANVAGLLLARGAARQRELAVRAALGGGRWRLVRQQLTESALLGVAGGALGLLFAAWMLDALLSGAPPDTPRLDEVQLNARLCALGVAVALGAGLLAGITPALQASTAHLIDSLRDAPGSTGSPRRARARRALVVLQLALALTLVSSAALMAESLRRAFASQLGYQPRGVLTVELAFPHERFKSTREAGQLNARLLERVAAIPGVESAATTSALPSTGTWHIDFERADRPPPAAGQRDAADVVWVSPGFRRTLQIALVAGRDLAATDTPEAPRMALVTETFARRYFPGESAVGKRIRVGARFYGEEQWPAWEIAGVVADQRQWGPDKEPRPQILLPQSQQGFPNMHLLIRSAQKPAQLAAAVRAEVAALAPEQPLGEVRTLEQVVAGTVGGRQIQTTIFGSAALVGLLLAALGVYGLVAWSVAQRTREIGIRLALGALPGQVLWMVIGEGFRLAVLGLALGMLGALGAGQALRASLYGTSATNPLVYSAVAALLAGVVALASFLPARRAARTSPLEALKAD